MDRLMTLEKPLVLKKRKGGFLPQQYIVLESPEFLAGTALAFVCPVISHSNVYVDIKVKLVIYEGSIWPGHGTKLAEYWSDPLNVAPEDTAIFTFAYNADKGSIDRRDVGVAVNYWDGSNWVDGGSHEWDDLFYVKAPSYSFEIGHPTVSAA